MKLAFAYINAVPHASFSLRLPISALSDLNMNPVYELCAKEQYLYKKKIFVQTATSRSLSQGDHTHPSIFEAGTSIFSKLYDSGTCDC